MNRIAKQIISVFLMIAALVLLLPSVGVDAAETRTARVWNYGSLKVRTGIGTKYAQCGLLVKGAYVTVDGEGKDSGGTTWYHVNYLDQIVGYVNGKYIEFCEIPQYSYDPDFEYYMNQQGFPESYKPYLRQLHAQYPNWVFQAKKSVLNWTKALDTQTMKDSPTYDYTIKSLISGDSISSWKATDKNAYDWTTGKWTTGFDSGNLVVASREITAYYMDPRNFLTTEGVFMFLDHSFNESQTVEGVREIAKGTFLEVNDSGTTLEENKTNQIYNNGDNSIYYDVDGSVIDYPAAIYNAANENSVNPYVLASMMIQELGTGKGKAVSSIINGAYTGALDETVYRKLKTDETETPVTTADGTAIYEGYFNYYNIGAYAESGRTAIERGLLYAKGWTSGENTSYGRPWDSRYKALCGGAKFMYESYTSQGQNTYYLKKFNIQSEACAHQWMTNVDGCYAETIKMATGYTESARNQNVTFIIPVYDGMPSEPCPIPMGDGSPNNKLSDIKVSGGALSCDFNMDIESYTVNVNKKTTSVIVSAAAYDSKAVISGVGTIALSSEKKYITITVKAENGEVRNYLLNINYVEEASETQMPASIESGVTLKDGKAIGISNGNNKSTVLQSIKVSNGTCDVLSAAGETISDGDYIGTGTKLVVYDLSGLENARYTVVVTGDATGDGLIKTNDLIKLRNHILNTGILTNEYADAADINADGSIKTGDLIKIRNHLLGTDVIK